MVVQVPDDLIQRDCLVDRPHEGSSTMALSQTHDGLVAVVAVEAAAAGLTGRENAVFAALVVGVAEEKDPHTTVDDDHDYFPVAEETAYCAMVAFVENVGSMVGSTYWR
jgi:hypothetical protein